MPVRIRLQRHGRRKRPFYHIVAADARSPRDGRFIEKLGTYNPMTVPATIELDRMAAYQWLVKGAQPSDTVNAILRFKGVLYFKHLMRGVSKGALTQEQASEKWEAFIESKEGKVAARREAEAQRIANYHVAVSGTAPAKPEPVVEEEVVEEAAPAVEATEEAAEVGSTEESRAEAADVAGEAIAEAEAAAAAGEALEAAAEETPEGASDVEKEA
ncbi:30S ribosomal protein S16 [Neolewinella lacunae]|uniref:Small ribosomal subunit protein bS16 n=1 Tax=Neolewinella lacunae TaxID=1517758 RepID=A0A923PKR3_9BACT|nr:30S ribosomal protein S16 [Neolewinella lacunae]MBC6993094.1 30S ribosomal protein S16 [Neolewinella lacunae]MDN3635914.1 30S ribosomal protein S16 [Neolewinella lacunae]